MRKLADTSTSTTSRTRLPPKNLGMPLPPWSFLRIDLRPALHSPVFAASATRAQSPSGLRLWSIVGKPFERVFRFSLMPNFEIERGPIERSALTGSPHDLIACHP